MMTRLKTILSMSVSSTCLFSTSILAQQGANPFAEREPQEGAAIGAAIGGIIGGKPEQNPANPANGGKPKKEKVEHSKLDETRLSMIDDLSFYRNVPSIMQMRVDIAKEQAGEDKEEVPKMPDTAEMSESSKKKAIKKYEDAMRAFKVGQELKVFRRNVILGKWKEAEKYLLLLPKDKVEEVYTSITSELCSSEDVSPIDYLEELGVESYEQAPVMLPEDIVAWIDISPTPPSDENLKEIAKELLRFDGDLPLSFYERMKKGTRYLGGKDIDSIVRATKLLIYSGRAKMASPYLEDIRSVAGTNPEALNSLANYHNSMTRVEPYSNHLEVAWQLTRELLKRKDLKAELEAEAMIRAFELLPQLEDPTQGKEWFKQTFAAEKSKGVSLLTFVGQVASQSKGHRAAEFRYQKIRLQHAAANALIHANEEGLKDWSEQLTLYAKNWLHEAEYTFQRDESSSMGPALQRDSFGNVYYAEENYDYDYDDDNYPIKAANMIRTGPDDRWLSVVDELTRIQCLKYYALLYLKVKKDNEAFPYVEKIAKLNPSESKRLISKLISVWTENHDPNAGQSYRNSWYYSYGYNSRADYIPLTRSKQARNLELLGELAVKLRNMGLTMEDEVLLVKAFIRCHSQAEIWRLDKFEEIFGDSSNLHPEAIAQLIQAMRANLIRVWPDPKLQKQAKTKRTDIELQREIIRGFNSAIELTKKMLAKHPDQWKLTLQLATLSFSRNMYLTQIGQNTSTRTQKENSLKIYQAAANHYIDMITGPQARSMSLDVFENWFYAALGSAELAMLKSHHQMTEGELDKIKQTINSLPPRMRKAHMNAFANVVATRISGVAPDLKLRYLKAALQIVGDNERAEEAKRLYDYYQDLVREIQLVTKVDGSSQINPDEPFGITVYLRHTKEIEREAGGFQKYLQNQKSGGGGYYNYGRPEEDYRDKFEEKARVALQEHFDVQSITFHAPDTESYTDEAYGWRVTPYAYITLKPKGKQVDMIPSLQIDFDFLDTSNYVVIPIASAKLPIDCSGVDAKYRDIQNVKITQTFDDRAYEKDKKLTLEIRVQAHGLIPPVESMLDMKEFDGFEIVKIDDQANLVQSLDPLSEKSPVMSVRNATVHLEPIDDRMPGSFTFPTATVEVSKKDGMLYHKYDDVDLIDAEQTISLVENNSMTKTQLTLYIVGGVLVLLGLIFLLIKLLKKPAPVAEAPSKYNMPEDLTPVTALSVLEKISGEDSINDEQRAGINADMEAIMKDYFGKSDTSSSLNLKDTLKRWIGIV